MMPMHCCRHETYRGSSKVKLADGNVDSQKPWKTMNQVTLSFA